MQSSFFQGLHLQLGRLFTAHEQPAETGGAGGAETCCRAVPAEEGRLEGCILTYTEVSGGLGGLYASLPYLNHHLIFASFPDFASCLAP